MYIQRRVCLYILTFRVVIILVLLMEIHGSPSWRTKQYRLQSIHSHFQGCDYFGSPLWRFMDPLNGDPNIHSYCKDCLCLDLQSWDPWISMKENLICSSINSKYLDLHLGEPNFMIQHVLLSLDWISTLENHFGSPLFWISKFHIHSSSGSP